MVTLPAEVDGVKRPALVEGVNRPNDPEERPADTDRRPALVDGAKLVEGFVGCSEAGNFRCSFERRNTTARGAASWHAP